MATLYELSQDLLAVKNLLEYGELDEDTARDTIESIEGAAESKLESIGKLIQEMEGEKLALKNEIERLKAREASKTKAIDRLREYVQSYLVTQDIKSIEAGLFKYSLRKSTYVDITGEVPDEFMKVELTPMKKEIKDYLKNNEASWASIKERQSLMIK